MKGEMTMPRKRRKESNSRIYHVMLRGVNRQAFSMSIKKLHDQGISIRQISRLTGLSKRIIENCLR
jgi:hypothetical protein